MAGVKDSCIWILWNLNDIISDNVIVVFKGKDLVITATFNFATNFIVVYLIIFLDSFI